MSIDARIAFTLAAAHGSAYIVGPLACADLRTTGDLVACDDATPEALHCDVIAACARLDASEVL